jgi:ubiquinone/menaquinone biosynthesis C-methylase UbiE
MGLSRQYVKLCEREDFDDAELRAALVEVVGPVPPERQLHRKYWEYAMLALYLREVGKLGERCEVLGVAAGHEEVLYWLANHTGRVVATDIYGDGSFAAGEAQAEMLGQPQRYAPYPYRRDRLEVRHADARRLPFPAASFDVVYSLSSIEHFGGPRDVADAAREMARVLRPDGHLLLATECFLGRHPFDIAVLQYTARVLSAGRLCPTATPRHRVTEVFTPGELRRRVVEPTGLRLVQPLRPAVSQRSFENVITFGPAGTLTPATGRDYPHIVLRSRGAPWTSAFLAFRK